MNRANISNFLSKVEVTWLRIAASAKDVEKFILKTCQLLGNVLCLLKKEKRYNT